jgi:glutathione S-transferase
VDCWIDVLTGDIFPGLHAVNYAMWGVKETDKKVVKSQVKASMKKLDFLDQFLKEKTYLE